MGDPKFSKRKYHTPSHPWQSERIKEDNELIHKYGLKNKREVWKAKSMLTSYRQTARTLLARLRTGDEQAMREKDQLLARLNSLGILGADAQLDDVLALNVENFLARRLQTVIYMKGLAYTQGQARQFIVHGHISVSGKKVTVPSYMIKRKEEEFIEYYDTSRLKDPDHPMVPKSAFEEEAASQVKGKIDLAKPDEEEAAEEKTGEDKKEKGKKPAKADKKKGGKKDDKKPDNKAEGDKSKKAGKKGEKKTVKEEKAEEK
jgi:small subunit ribosomal protein S4